MLQFTTPTRGLHAGTLYRWANLWIIERTDGFILRGTDHNHNIVFLGEIYETSNPVSPSAEARSSNLETTEREIHSIVTDDRITYEDLTYGKYDEAKITQYLIDWKYPHAGAFIESVMWIVDMEWNDGEWKASTEGVSRYLKPNVGRTYTRNEPVAGPFADTEDARGDLSVWTSTKFISAVSGPGEVSDGVVETLDGRQRIKLGSMSAVDEGYYINGVLVAVTGANAGRTFDIATHYTDSLKLFLEAPDYFQIGDQVQLIAGYSGNFSEAKTKFLNTEGFRGFPYIPGTDRLMVTPDAR